MDLGGHLLFEKGLRARGAPPQIPHTFVRFPAQEERSTRQVEDLRPELVK